ncbi:ABC transporter ATP-binding protein [Fusibacter sp. 3D3]|uniref:ABC transporter ATP-binding protein n=1 Tax=Fusibacter sp. 3D3 TaxID=1048380 RepID=UPI000852C991|nr:ABC transporter ATP-binding protein [Fusibacter sp. 3D3]GAU76243.1 oligopeptide transport ATP-binding protein OppF [Fusibacter sp. 3D3]
MEPLIQLKNIRVKFPVKRGFASMIAGQEKKVVHAVNGINLEIGKSEIMALVGESGSGKTTLGKVITVLHPKDAVAGEIVFLGESLWDEKGKLKSGYHQEVCMIFQDPYQSLNPKHKIEKIVSEPLVVNKISKSKAVLRVRVIQALEDAGLVPAVDFLDRYPHELSGGQRQRVVVASALVMSPKLIVADEPVSMLDVSIRSEILKLLLKLRDEKGISCLFITHDISLAWAISDKIGVMYLGTMLEYGDTESVIQNPQNPYTRALIDIMPKMRVRKNEKRMLLKGETPNPIELPEGCVFHPRCPLAMACCKATKPPSRDVGNGHINVCHLLE